MSKHTLRIGALALGALTFGCGRGEVGDVGVRGTAGTSGPGTVAAMTIQGCVVEGTPAGTYMLRTTDSEFGEPGEMAGTSGSNPPSHLPEIKPEYRLIATGNLDLGRHLGKEVAVTGEVADRAPGDRGAVGTSGSSSLDRTRRRGTGGEGRAEFFRVTQVAGVSDGCPTPDDSKTGRR